MSELIKEFGIPIAFVIIEGIVIAFLYRELKSERTRNDSLQDSRLVDARETRDKITEHMDSQSRMAKQTYDLLSNFINRGQ